MWVATNGSDATCVRGNQSFPCLTLNRGYQIAQGGDEILVRAGSYGNQTIGTGTKTSQVTMTFASGATAGNVLIQGAKRLTIVDMTANMVYAGENSASAAGQTQNIILRNVDLKYFFGRSVLGLEVYDSSIGGTQDGTSPTVGAAYQSSVYSTGVCSTTS